MFSDSDLSMHMQLFVYAESRSGTTQRTAYASRCRLRAAGFHEEQREPMRECMRHRVWVRLERYQVVRCSSLHRSPQRSSSATHCVWLQCLLMQTSKTTREQQSVALYPLSRDDHFQCGEAGICVQCACVHRDATRGHWLGLSKRPFPRQGDCCVFFPRQCPNLAARQWLNCATLSQAPYGSNRLSSLAARLNLCTPRLSTDSLQSSLA